MSTILFTAGAKGGTGKSTAARFLITYLQAIQLYKAYYESIPAAVQEAAAMIEKLKKEIESFSMDAQGLRLQVADS